MEEKLIYDIEICAVIFGADKTILNLDIGNGFKFREMTMIPNIDELDKIFETDAMGLRRDYEAAKIDDNLNLICIYKSYSNEFVKKEVSDEFEKITNNTLKYLDDKIRGIRLLLEGPVRFKKLAIKIRQQMPIQVEKINMSFKRVALIPISEAMHSTEISKLKIDEIRVDEINRKLKSLKFPISNELLNNCHRYYDLSYHRENCIAITLLTTCLEMLFLNKKENAKKERVAKRCSVLLYDNKEDRLDCYARLLKTYKKDQILYMKELMKV
ncbi:hypothetical protein [Acetivibrio straminisolvens]|uniref:Uncharacterized protein n=1 Tax=Acetivibrio straminisolvens JCM 21531 TaxID=1294263 RepID=W4VE52_9FIRM|nr:hypothetical protein [Acetivibrio straminisolvens]GAE91029.1 hypothetical protein JCM21531_4701 [Acetivibrio straminisolvens JCM 21531]